MSKNGKASAEIKLNKSASKLKCHAPNLSIAFPPIKAAITNGRLFISTAAPVTIAECVCCQTITGIAIAAIWLPNNDKNSALIKPAIGM